MGKLEVVKVIRAREAKAPLRIVDPAPTEGFAKFTESESAAGDPLPLDDALARAGYLAPVDEDAFLERHRKTVASRFAKIGLGKHFPPAIRTRLDQATHLRSLFVDDIPFHEILILAWATYADSRVKTARASQRPMIIESFGFPPGFFPLHEPTNMPMTAIAVWGRVSDNQGIAYSKAMDWLAERGDLKRYTRSDDPSFATRSGIVMDDLFARSPTVPHEGRCFVSFGIPLKHEEAERLIRKAGCVPGSFRDLIRHLTPETIRGRRNHAYPQEREPEWIGGIVSGAPIVALSPIQDPGVPCFSATPSRGVTLDFASLGGGGFPAQTRFIALSGATPEKRPRRAYETREVPGTTRDGILL